VAGSFIKDYYKQRNGTINGLPLSYVNVNIVAQDFLQPQCEDFIDDYNLPMCANDYNSNPSLGPVQTNRVHDMFATPFLKPIFAIINCVSNSTAQSYLQLLLNEDGGLITVDYGAYVTRWRTAIDSVQAPRPELTDTRLTPSGALAFTLPGQRGRTNQVQVSSDLLNWTTVTNVSGTNAPVVFRDTNVVNAPRRFYRVRRL